MSAMEQHFAILLGSLSAYSDRVDRVEKRVERMERSNGSRTCGQEAVDGFLERGVGQGAPQHPDGFDLAVGCHGAQEKRRCILNPQLLSLGQAIAHLRGIFIAVQTLLKSITIEADGFGMGGQILRHQGLLIIEQPIVHFPIFPLVAGTMGRFGSLEGVFM